MNHRKANHLEKVSKCRNLSEGNCNAEENFCWFAHPRVEKESENMETDEELNESVFHKEQMKTPPDQLTDILKMIQKLSFQVKELEKKSSKKQ